VSEVQFKEYQKEILPLRHERSGKAGHIRGWLRVLFVQFLIVQFLSLNTRDLAGKPVSEFL
jgi:hypothetical protein